MFKSRHTIALFIIALYFIPFLLLSFYGMQAMRPEKAWTFFSLGLCLGIIGSLIFFYSMMQFEQEVTSDEDETEEAFRTPYTEDENEGLDAIITNLNEELETKRKEIQYLSSENFNLKHRLEEVELKLKAKTEEKEKEKEKVLAPEVEAEEEVQVEVEVEKEKEFLKVEPVKVEMFEEALTPSKIEENLYRKTNRIEVTRL